MAPDMTVCIVATLATPEIVPSDLTQLHLPTRVADREASPISDSEVFAFGQDLTTEYDDVDAPPLMVRHDIFNSS